METTAHRAVLSEIAAPPGGWPSLARELVEVRFFMDRGELDEAFELLAILRERHPGHPELTEFKRGAPDGKPRPDTQVNRVVDSVLSGSAALNDAIPRRAAPTWNDPRADAAEPEAEAEAAPPAASDDSVTQVRKRVVRRNEEHQAGSFPTVAEAEAEAESEASASSSKHTKVQMVVPPASPPGRKRRVRSITNRQHAPVPVEGSVQSGTIVDDDDDAEEMTRQHVVPEGLREEIDPSKPLVSLEPTGTPTSTTRPEPTVPPTTEPAAEEVAAEPASAEPTPAEPVPDGHVRPLPAVEPQMTVAVPTLQPAAPYRGTEGEATAEAGDPAPPSRRRGRNVVRKRAIKARKRSGAHEVVEQSGEGTEDGQRRRRARPVRFGQHVLGRLGGKD